MTAFSKYEQIVIISSIVEKFAYVFVRTVYEKIELVLDEDDVVSTDGKSVNICSLVEEPTFKDEIFSLIHNHLVPINFIHFFQFFSSILILS